MKKVTIILLTGLICLLGATALAYNEAPMLRVKVATGELSPIEERLPKEPLVVEPCEAIGKYGGVLTLAHSGPSDWSPLTQANSEYMLMLDRAGKKVIPNIAKGWEFSDDGKTFTLYLRKGMRWSDGVPFTADDILFYWEDVVLDDELTPVKPSYWMPGDKLMEVEKVNDYTVRFHFAKPYWTVIYNMCSAMFRGQQNGLFLPKHALKKYHIKYNKEADKLAGEEGYDYWWELFGAVRTMGTGITPEKFVGKIPILEAWVLKKVLPIGTIWERNPYYFKVDTAGNQLPYIDKLRGIMMADRETYKAKIMAGELDFEGWLMTAEIAMYPLLKENEKKGGYRALLIKSIWSSAAGLFCNQNYKEDPILGEILRDVRFRQALSLAIDREDINEALYLGEGVPRQATPIVPPSDIYEAKWARSYAQYDPEEANRLLEEMGLKWDKDHKYRLRPDGKVLTLIISVCDFMPNWVPTAELVKEYWKKIGIKVAVRSIEISHLVEWTNAAKHQVSIWAVDCANEFSFIPGQGAHFRGSWFVGQWAVDWQRWQDTKGEKGEEPPAWVKRIFSLVDSLPFLSEEERIRAAKEYCETQAERLWVIGTVGLIPQPAIFNAKLGNVYEDCYGGNAGVGGVVNVLLQQWFWKK